MKCPLCLSNEISFYYENQIPLDDKKIDRIFKICNKCSFVFIDQKQHLSYQVDRKRYLDHENTIDWKGDYQNDGYFQYLNRLWGKLKPLLNDGDRGLDYGSGPHPSFSELIARDGFRVASYDPIFLKELKLLEAQFDFVVCNEVVEHFKNPIPDWETLINCVKPKGYLAVQTCFVPSDKNSFAQWHYQRDPTHVSFYNEHSIKYIAQTWSLEICRFIRPSIVILRKN